MIKNYFSLDWTYKGFTLHCTHTWVQNETQCNWLRMYEGKLSANIDLKLKLQTERVFPSWDFDLKIRKWVEPCAVVSERLLEFMVGNWFDYWCSREVKSSLRGKELRWKIFLQNLPQITQNDDYSNDHSRYFIHIDHFGNIIFIISTLSWSSFYDEFVRCIPSFRRSTLLCFIWTFNLSSFSILTSFFVSAHFNQSCLISGFSRAVLFINNI